MKDQLQQIVESMRKYVLKNLELIKVNETHIKEILSWPISAERTKELNESYQYSRTLLSENNDFINLQVNIMNFLNKYRTLIEDEVIKVKATADAKIHQHISREDYFQMTVENDISFDDTHPYFEDQEFFHDLLSYFQENENYEMCAHLIKYKK
jgi:hypothetical protein